MTTNENKPGEIKILVADDHNVVRTGIIKSLAENFPSASFGEAANSADVLRLVSNEKWDLVILDISMPGRNGLEVLKSIKEFCPKTPVIILSMYPEDQFAMRSLKAGASAYLTKEISSKKLAEAVSKTLKGEVFLTDPVAKILTDGLWHDHDKTPHELLSDREFEVFLLIASGKSVSDIAQLLSLSVKTISVYRSNILKKMNLKNNAEITNYAFKFKLVE
jgi:two-component system, NarL family, invasion response regulator UvrY